MTFNELVEWFTSNLGLVNRFSGDVVFFAIEWPDPESENWRAGYKHWGDDGDTYFFRNIVGRGSTPSTALRASYKKTELLITSLQKLVGNWQPAKLKDLRVGDYVVSYGLNWDGELTYSKEEVTGFPRKEKEWFASAGKRFFESGQRLYGYQLETFAQCCQIEKK
jgi:hypothetical protein